MLEIRIEANENRIDTFLAEKYKELSRSKISKKIKDGSILVNARKVKPSYILEQGDLITIDSLDEKKTLPQAERMDLDIVYEDDYLIVVNKPKGLVVHPGKDNMSSTLVNGLLAHTDRLSNLDGDFRPGIVHRLDKDTSGLLVVAKDNDSHRALKLQLMEKKMKRQYLALVEGRMDLDRGFVEEPIGRDPRNRLKMCVISENSKEARTDFEVLERFDKYTYIKASLYTGRMHQIRVHMSYIGHPIVGDGIYGKKSNEFKLKDQLLHSYKIAFKHPVSGDYMEFENKESKDLNGVLNKLRLF